MSVFPLFIGQLAPLEFADLERELERKIVIFGGKIPIDATVTNIRWKTVIFP
jgi:hypothetical protein